jgi:hypothetical protein
MDSFELIVVELPIGARGPKEYEANAGIDRLRSRLKLLCKRGH